MDIFLPEPVIHKHSNTADEDRLENDHEDDGNGEIEVAVDRIEHTLNDHRRRVVCSSGNFR